MMLENLTSYRDIFSLGFKQIVFILTKFTSLKPNVKWFALQIQAVQNLYWMKENSSRHLPIFQITNVFIISDSRCVFKTVMNTFKSGDQKFSPLSFCFWSFLPSHVLVISSSTFSSIFLTFLLFSVLSLFFLYSFWKSSN